jgi:hypothetical protein
MGQIYHTPSLISTGEYPYGPKFPFGRDFRRYDTVPRPAMEHSRMDQGNLALALKMVEGKAEEAPQSKCSRDIGHRVARNIVCVGPSGIAMHSVTPGALVNRALSA